MFLRYQSMVSYFVTREMSQAGPSNPTGGVSRSGRVRKKSTKLMESLEVRSGKPDKYGKVSPQPETKFYQALSPQPEFSVSHDDSNLSDAAEELIEEHVEEIIKSEQLPLSEEGLPLAVPASGYYSYDGKFSSMLPKKEKKKRKKKEAFVEEPSKDIQQEGFLDLSVVKQEIDTTPEDTLLNETPVVSDTPVKKKKAGKFKDKLWDAEWEKLKKKKKKRREKEKLAKTMKIQLCNIKQEIVYPENDSSSETMGLVIAEPEIALPPKKRKKSEDDRTKLDEAKKAKKLKSDANKPGPDDLIIRHSSKNEVTMTLEHLAAGGSIEEENLVPAAAVAVVSSQYLSEKKKPKKKRSKFVVGEDGVVTTKKRRPRPITAYMLFCKENRPKIVAQDPSQDFAAISRKMGEKWQSLTDNVKMLYRRRAKKIGRRGSMISTGKKLSGKQSQESKVESLIKRLSSPTGQSRSSDLFPVYKVTGTDPIDIAAHLRLLGESLTIIGERLTENEGHIAVSGTLSVMLDAALCTLGPLLCLTNQIEELNAIPPETQSSMLDSIAYIMPGL